MSKQAFAGGDNGRRARAYPRVEGRCGACQRWVPLFHRWSIEAPPPLGARLARHRCASGRLVSRQEAVEVTSPPVP